MTARRTALLVLLLSTAVVAAAQRPLNPPNYYTFQLPQLLDGQPVSGELTTDDGQNFKDGSYLDMFVFEGRVDEYVSITVSSGEFDPYLTVYDSYGYLVARNDDYGMGTDAGVDIWLPETGKYIVVVSGYSEYDLGYYVVQLTAGSRLPGADLRPLEIPGMLDSEITPDMPTLPGGYVGNTEYFSFEVTTPSFYVITMWSWDFDTVLTIFDEYGDIVAQNDDHDFSSDSQIAVELWPGNYVLAASSYYTGWGGYYTLDVRRYVEAD